MKENELLNITDDDINKILDMVNNGIDKDIIDNTTILSNQEFELLLVRLKLIILNEQYVDIMIKEDILDKQFIKTRKKTVFDVSLLVLEILITMYTISNNENVDIKIILGICAAINTVYLIIKDLNDIDKIMYEDENHLEKELELVEKSDDFCEKNREKIKIIDKGPLY